MTEKPISGPLFMGTPEPYRVSFYSESEVADLLRDAERWREVCDKAWFVDQAAFVYGLRSGSFSPTVDPDEVWAAIDAAMSS